MKIEDIMTKDVGTCSAAEGLHFAAGIMRDLGCGVVPVVDGRRVVGVITDRDICMTALQTGKALNEIGVESSMTADVLTCSPGDTIDRAEEIMRAGHVRRLPVVADDVLVGMISLDDIALATVRAEGEELLRGTPGEAHLARTLAGVYRRRVIVEA